MQRNQGQFILGVAWPVADLIVEYITLQPGVERAAIAGSIRRGLEIIQDIEIVAASTAPEALVTALTSMQGVEQAEWQDGNKLVLILTNGLVCRIYIVNPEVYIAALVYYTGSTGYVAKLAGQAAKHNLLFTAEGVRAKDGQQVMLAEESDFYTMLKLNYDQPELREDNTKLTPAGEIFTPVVSLQNVQGVVHVHTTYSDGASRLADMAAAAKERGWHYLGIADHSKTASYAGGLSIETVKAQRREIEKLNAENPEFRILAGIESDILPDGSLDYPEEILASFDFVVASVHSAFRQSEADMTKRIIKAMRNSYVTILGHPTGRLLLRRKGYAVNIGEVIAAAAQTGTIIEINSSPYRLDLDWRWCRLAKEQGVLFAINPDAHSVGEFEHMRYGMAAARKAGLSPSQVINTYSLPEVMSLLHRKRP